MKMGNLKKVFINSVLILLGFIFGLGISVFAWVNPSQSPPLGGGVLQTDNSGLKIVTTTQIISGNLTVNIGNVGIGTTNPNNLLQVVDLINFDNTDFNTFLGYQAGKNVVSGAQYNTFIGYQAGFSSSTAASSTADYNTAIGYRALFNNTTGYKNTAVGNAALYYNTTGFNNTAVGDEAGIYIADGTTPNATSTNSVYLGADTKASFSGATNEIVIGYGAVGAGSNSVVLGNDSITRTILKGNVGIGTTTPSQRLTVVGNIGIQAGSNAFIGTLDNYDLSLRTNNTDRIFISNTGDVGIATTSPAYRLDVNGTISVTGFRMSTGAQSGYVLTSDASGVGTWQPVSIGGLYLLTSFKPTPPGINQYQVPYAIGATAATTFTLSNGTTYWIPFSVSRSVTISQIAINVTTAATGVHQVGIYASNSLWQPTGSPLISSSFNTGTTGLKTASVSLTLQPGVYWVAWASGSAATVRAISLSSLASLGLASLGTSNTTMFSTSGSTLPDPAPTSGFTSLSSAVPAVGMIFSF
jgi:hypothetical protein